MTKATLTALGAALIALGTELQSEETVAPAADQPKKTRRGTAPAEDKPPGDGAATGPTPEEAKASFQPLVDAGHGLKVKEVLAKFTGAAIAKDTKFADLDPKHYPAFIAEIKKLKADMEAADI